MDEKEYVIDIIEKQMIEAKREAISRRTNGRAGFRRNFPFNGKWGGKHYPVKQVEVYAIKEGGDWIVVSVIARYF